MRVKRVDIVVFISKGCSQPLKWNVMTDLETLTPSFAVGFLVPASSHCIARWHEKMWLSMNLSVDCSH